MILIVLDQCFFFSFLASVKRVFIPEMPSDFSIEKSLLLVFGISKRLGLFPFTINKDGNFQASWLLLTLLFLISLSGVIFTAIYFFFLVGTFSWLPTFVCLLCIFFNNFYLCFSNTELYYKLKELNECITKLKLVWNIVFPVCIFTFPYSKTFLLVNFGSIFLMFVLDLHKYFFNSTYALFIVYVLFLGHLVSIVILVDRFSGFVSIFVSLFRMCNDELLLFCSSTTPTSRKRLERLAWTHDQLCDCGSIISDIHGFQIFLIKYVCIFAIVSSSYNCFYSIIHESWRIAAVSSSLCWISFYFRIAWRIVDVCEMCTTEVIMV